MLNFRKLKQDFSSNILKEGRELHSKQKVVSAKIVKLDNDVVRLSAKILGQFENTYESEIEIDRFESETIHSNCDCTYRYDCQHLAALLFYLEEHLNSLVVNYSKEKKDQIGHELLETIQTAKIKQENKKDAIYQKQLLEEYIEAAGLLSASAFFLPTEKKEITKAEIAVIFNPASLKPNVKNKYVEFSLALRLPFRSKALQIPYIKTFFYALQNKEPLFFSSKKYFFTLESFDPIGQKLLSILMHYALLSGGEQNHERAAKIGSLETEVFGTLLAEAFEQTKKQRGFSSYSEDLPPMPYLFIGGLENPLQCSFASARLKFDLEYIKPPSNKLLINPLIVVDQNQLALTETKIFECNLPGLIYKDIYYRLPPNITRNHVKNLEAVRDITIPEPLFGTFVECSLLELKHYADVGGEKVLNQFVTQPYVGDIKGKCRLSYIDGELEANLSFIYENNEVNAVLNQLNFEKVASFVTKDGIIARNLVEERKIIENLFQDFVYNPQNGSFSNKSEKKIVEFMTEIVPKFQDKIEFECPQNLLDRFVYDKTEFTLKLDYKDKVGYYYLDLKADGDLKGLTLDLLWECMASSRSYIELSKKKNSASSKILVLDLEKLSKIIRIFDEIGIKKMDNYKENRPLWSLVNIEEQMFKDLPIKFSISKKLKAIRAQMLGETKVSFSPIPKGLKAKLRPYQKEGIQWLEKLRNMYLNGILADDMGLGKTLQAIAAIFQHSQKYKKSISLIVCPTSLLYNWKEEFSKFCPDLKTIVIEGIPTQRRKILQTLKDYDVVITSYTLMQKDVEFYQKYNFAYAILDEAQHIKNRFTRNARSVKLISAAHRLILTGTPIENTLNELWSLFDFLMPGFLSSYDRFLENYIRVTGEKYTQNMQYLKRKVSPFILRRMKEDVLQDLPAAQEITYHCKLSGVQKELYQSYAESAKAELSKLVEKNGFDKVQIHVLATLTRLKQICCHPAIFAKEKAEDGDSAKYEMLLELLQTLVEGGHKTVIFSQYTQMLKIMRQDFEERGIRFSYLDGSSKDRLHIVKEFNKNPEIKVFLVSLKAGGTGLNIVGADTVVHYDMWWNPAVENQATDRVHRIGQTKSVSCYKLVTLNSIEEKILQMQQRKKGLVKKVVSCDDEAISKLTWEEVLELLQT